MIELSLVYMQNVNDIANNFNNMIACLLSRPKVFHFCLPPAKSKMAAQSAMQAICLQSIVNLLYIW